MVRSAKDWPWSGYRATAGQCEAPDWLQTEWILSGFSNSMIEARVRYRRFVAEGKNQPSPWDGLKNQIYLGSAEFVERTKGRLVQDKDLSEIPSAQRRPPPGPLAHYATEYPDRDTAITAAYAGGGYSMKEVGEYFGLHYSRISRIVRKAGVAKDKT